MCAEDAHGHSPCVLRLSDRASESSEAGRLIDARSSKPELAQSFARQRDPLRGCHSPGATSVWQSQAACLGHHHEALLLGVGVRHVAHVCLGDVCRPRQASEVRQRRTPGCRVEARRHRRHEQGLLEASRLALALALALAAFSLRRETRPRVARTGLIRICRRGVAWAADVFTALMPKPSTVTASNVLLASALAAGRTMFATAFARCLATRQLNLLETAGLDELLVAALRLVEADEGLVAVGSRLVELLVGLVRTTCAPVLALVVLDVPGLLSVPLLLIMVRQARRLHVGLRIGPLLLRDVLGHVAAMMGALCAVVRAVLVQLDEVLPDAGVLHLTVGQAEHVLDLFVVQTTAGQDQVAHDAFRHLGVLVSVLELVLGANQVRQVRLHRPAEARLLEQLSVQPRQLSQLALRERLLYRLEQARGAIERELLEVDVSKVVLRLAAQLAPEPYSAERTLVHLGAEHVGFRLLDVLLLRVSATCAVPARNDAFL